MKIESHLLVANQVSTPREDHNKSSDERLRFHLVDFSVEEAQQKLANFFWRSRTETETLVPPVAKPTAKVLLSSQL